MKQLFFPVIGLVMLQSCGGTGCDTNTYAETPKFYTAVTSREVLDSVFTYSEGNNTIISGHRGGMAEGYPENCIESFEHTLSMMPSFFEIDPRLTKDSIIVLMHDNSIDRTTTGKGLVGDYTFAELQKFNLVDHRGNITPYHIPTLDSAIAWSRDKAVLNLDIKDVPIELMASYIRSKAPANVIYTVRNASQMLRYCEADPAATFSIWCRNPKEYADYIDKDVDWSRVKVAYVGPTMAEEYKDLYSDLHERGIKCMISVAPTHDRCYNDSCRQAGYIMEYSTEPKPDIVETDYPYLFTDL